MALRIGLGHHIGASIGPRPPFHQIFGTTAPLFAFQSDMNVSLVSGAVDTWGDTSGHGVTMAFFGARPTLNAGGVSSSVPGIKMDGATQSLKLPITRPAPGTTPTFFLGIYRATATNAAANAKPFSGTTNMTIFHPTGGSLATSYYDGTIVATGYALTATQWYVMQFYMSNSAADFAKFGAHSKVAICGNNAEAGAFWLGGVNGAQFCKSEWGALLGFPAQPTAGELSAFMTAAKAWCPTVETP